MRCPNISLSINNDILVKVIFGWLYCVVLLASHAWAVGNDEIEKTVLPLLQAAYPEAHVQDWQWLKPNRYELKAFEPSPPENQTLFHLTLDDELINLIAFGPLELGIDNEGQRLFLLGSILNKLPRQPVDTHWIGIYRTDQDGEVQQLFKKTFPALDDGDFMGIELTDVTGDGVPEIKIAFVAAWHGASLTGWKETIFLLQSRPPFDTLLELLVEEREGELPDGTPHHLQSEIEVRDLNRDGINELLVTRYEGRDWHELTRTADSPQVYRLVNGRYERDTPTP